MTRPSGLDVAAALGVLRAAGWTIRDDDELGQLAPGIDPPLLMVALGYDPANQRFVRTVAQMPWTAKNASGGGA